MNPRQQEGGKRWMHDKEDEWRYGFRRAGGWGCFWVQLEQMAADVRTAALGGVAG